MKMKTNMQRHFCVTVYVKDFESDSYLMVFHKKLKRWLPPGGHVDENELPEDAALRECFEETGLKAHLVDREPLIEGGMVAPFGIQLNVIEPSSHEHMDLIYFAQSSRMELLTKNDHETDGVGWFTREQILSEDFNTFDNVKRWINHFSKDEWQSDSPKSQNLVREFCRKHHFSNDPHINLLDLASEVGELSKEYLKASDYGKRSFAPSRSWCSELGDVMFSLACLANQTGVDLCDALAGAMSKYDDRIAKRGSPSSYSKVEETA